MHALQNHVLVTPLPIIGNATMAPIWKIGELFQTIVPTNPIDIPFAETPPQHPKLPATSHTPVLAGNTYPEDLVGENTIEDDECNLPETHIIFPISTPGDSHEIPSASTSMSMSYTRVV